MQVLASCAVQLSLSFDRNAAEDIGEGRCAAKVSAPVIKGGYIKFQHLWCRVGDSPPPGVSMWSMQSLRSQLI